MKYYAHIYDVQIVFFDIYITIKSYPNFSIAHAIANPIFPAPAIPIFFLVIINSPYSF